MELSRTCYREVIPDQTLPEKWKDFTLNTGGTQSTLQDIKVPQRAGGYSYKDPSKQYARNRFIYWRLYDDILELIEHSLDVNLIGNQVRYRFQDSPVLEGLTIHETLQGVVVLVSTVSSIHRLKFPYYDRGNRQDYIWNQHPESSVQSVFANAPDARDPASFYVISNNATNTLMPYSSASWLCSNNDALFALAYTNGTILLARHNDINGTVATMELKQESLTSRIFFLTGALRGRPNEENVVASMTLHSFGSDTYLFCLGRSGQLRIWSCSRGQCVSVSDVLDDAAEQGRNLTQGAQSHVLKKAMGGSGNENDLLLGVFLCFSTECQFIVLQISYFSGSFRPSRLFSIRAPTGQDLVDFSLCQSQLWAVWRNTQGDTAVSTVNIHPSNPRGDAFWRPAVLEPGPDREFVVHDSMTDPRQAYVSYIFHPGRFSLPVIMKALSIFRRSSEMSLMNEMTSSVAILKERVCQAVETEIQNEFSDEEYLEMQNEVSDEEYLEVANRCWGKFYSCCVQYHLSGSRPVGLVLLNPSQNNTQAATAGVALVNKAYVSLLRPMDPLEVLFTTGLAQETHSQGTGLGSDTSNLVQVINMLELRLSDDIKSNIERDLYRLLNPENVVKTLAQDLLQSDSMSEEYGFDLVDLEQHLRNISNIPAAIGDLLGRLVLSPLAEVDPNQIPSSDMARQLLLVSNLFSSHFGMCTVAETMRQIAVMRFSLCRNLLLLQYLLLQQRDELCSVQEAYELKNKLVPQTIGLIQAYLVVVWICDTPASPVVKPNVLENSIQRMSILKLSDATGTATAAATALGSTRALQKSYSLLELFLQATGVRQVHRHLACLGPDGDFSMLSFVALLSQLIWPISDHIIFLEFLLSSCQHLLVQEYVRLLSRWCESNICSRKFLLGSALLDMGESHKALDLFIDASAGLKTEHRDRREIFLETKILGSSESSSESRAVVTYLLKVIQLFEQQNCPDCVIQLAKNAIQAAERDDPDLPTLHSIAFVNHLRLEHHEEAYQSLNSNPDSARRVDCLRQLVVNLFELHRLDLLLEFPYENLVQDLERIVESRARSLDISNPAFYNFLYAFHIKKLNFRKAATVMYEQGMRLGCEGTHLAELTERQAKCFLACLNALQLVEPKYAWILKPVVSNEPDDDIGTSPKRGSDGEELNKPHWKREVDVMEIADIRTEYEVVQCRLRLLRHSPDKYKRTGCRLVPSELVAVLSQVGMYQAAIKLCRAHKLPFQPVLESLASACVRLTNMESTNRDPTLAWEWLAENDLRGLGIDESNPVKLAWRLLEVVLMSCEEDMQTVLHKAVSSRLLACGVFLPNWLASSYKERNLSELLRLLLGTGRLIEAGALALECLQAGRDNLSLTGLGNPTCLPIRTIELLCLELQRVTDGDEEYTKV
ncbi:hypothetical protein ONE63_008234 [Megalurothrips usitatus]|uniref:Nuclear pore complex protein Nup160 homolog n=1 Tax=Megalurothrips usitatus TaxID=439358 RepID=A0AAV7XKH2_9NEOP|nr:hypothetical protein ONE63_008234 [Megalurothrips usitatus]